MSRRSRKKGESGSWLGKVLIGCGVLLVLALGFGYAGLFSYLQSDGFRRFLSAEVSDAAEVRGEFEQFRWDGLAVETDGFEAVGEGVISSIKAERIGTEISFGGFSRGVWVVKPTRIGVLEVNFSEEKDEDKKDKKRNKKREKVAKGGEKGSKKSVSGWIPREVELESLEIGRVSLSAELEDGDASVKGMSVTVLPAGGEGAYEAEVKGGVVNFPNKWVPELKIDKISGVYRGGALFLNEASLSGWKDGRIEAVGEFDLEDKTVILEGDIGGLRSDELFDENWARRLTGDLSSTFVFDNRSGKDEVSGELKFQNATMTALPMLDALAAYADTRRFRVMQLSEGRTMWRYSKDEILLDDLVFASEGLIRLEGSVSIKGESIDGTFQLGLVPGVLSHIPGAETVVFKSGSHGLLWTPLRITGTLDDMDEDLTGRLVEAAGLRMFERLPKGGELALKFAGKAIGGDAGKVMKGGGEKVMEKADKVLKNAGSLLEGLFK